MPQAASTFKRATGDANMESSTMKKSQVEFPCVVTPITPDEEGFNESLDFAARSFHDSTNSDEANPAP
ncbi:hypothetical protein GUJ93_ZPchr0009g1605 [Zizania palustris]|uniref:Uncharacterized protein n=1 Tax=Zizania palustris TaxID=103762 RepID=A0A8J5RC03_ZIZPA|nr:hypothetical protein GUJ93_ZPchr0009g1605 [Zizania palustris]